MAGPKATERRVKALERKEARRGYKSAKKAAKTLCESVERQREARELAKRAERLRGAELRRVIRACERATKAEDEARAEYLRTLPSPEERAMQRRRRERALERRELPRRDAIARVVEVHGAPEAVAEMAVRRAERRAGSSLPPPSNPRRWERLAEAVTSADVAESWKRWERKQRRGRDELPELEPEPEEQVIVIVDEDDFSDPPF